VSLRGGWSVLVVCAALGGACAAVRFPPDVSPHSRALWVWSTEEILRSPDQQRALLDFSMRKSVGALWMQVTTGRVDSGSNPHRLRLTVTHAAKWRPLIRAAHERGLKIEALDGDPTYADAAFHHIPLAITDAVIAFNRESPPSERFDGVHFDNEPYLLPGWNDPMSRETLVSGHLAVIDKIQRRVERARPLTFGVDLPFWWDLEAAAQILARVDAVTVMDYRNEAAGPDGLVGLAAPLLEEAARVGHADVRVGVETRSFRESLVWFVTGPPAAVARRMLEQSWRLRYPRDPLRLRSLDDGTRVHLGVVLDVKPAGPRAPAEELLMIARDYGVPIASADVMEPTLEGNIEWRDATPAPILDPSTGIRYAGFIATNFPHPKLTFATRPAAFSGETAAAERAFRQFPNYRGLAIHDYDAFRLLR